MKSGGRSVKAPSQGFRMLSSRVFRIYRSIAFTIDF